MMGISRINQLQNMRPFFENFFGDQARGSDGRSADYSYYSLSNYDHLTLKEEDLPPYIRDIVKVGLNYLARVVVDLEDRDVCFLRHQRVDILYVMVAYFPPLTQTSFDDGYIIHYYDNPLQAAISPAWSDQNVLGGSRKVSVEIRKLRALNDEQFRLRQDCARSALMAPDPQAALENRYAEKLLQHNEHHVQARALGQVNCPVGSENEFSKHQQSQIVPAGIACCCFPSIEWLAKRAGLHA